MENQDPDKEDQIRAKQAISPAGLGDRADNIDQLPDDMVPMGGAPSDELEDEYMDGDELGANVREMHPNRNRDGKPDLDKPAYGGS
ncbi:hypothetical protein DYU11_06905 [Fibrisoma montanum]|uniref:Uncharacterized protein n=1 Tax=Fibrisoma montanum TaxID=2305895 RepID=A0A418ME37_9BACT|nr:hypothetical protein [Fibrisoma montanum]RIV25041.1 hypothetical protein DYU11_06905 [Fibrisoma montanum]